MLCRVVWLDLVRGTRGHNCRVSVLLDRTTYLAVCHFSPVLLRSLALVVLAAYNVLIKFVDSRLGFYLGYSW